MSARDPGQRHLLVVDDDDRIRDLLRRYLSREGLRVTTAADAAAARRLVETLDCAFDLDRGELSRGDAPVRLTEAEARLLKTLAQNAHAAVDRLDLASDGADARARAVDVQVTRLRRKLEADP